MGSGQRWRSGKPARDGVTLVVSWRWVWGVILALAMLCYVMALMGSAWCRWGDLASSLGSSDGDSVAGAVQRAEGMMRWEGDVRDLEVAWNRLCYGSTPPVSLQIALFVKKWPTGGTPGGLERHAMTLHRVLADRGHVVHVFTMRQPGGATADADEEAEEERRHPNMHLHFIAPNAGGGFDHSRAWERFSAVNASRAFDIVHSESVALPHWRAHDFDNLAASWHGIAFEVIHSDIVQDLIRKPGEPRTQELEHSMTGRLMRIADEVRFFPSYRHHVATSDYVGDVLRTIYELPLRNVHIILNGVNEHAFRPDPAAGTAFRAQYGVPENASLVLGAAGRLVRDKGHPLLFEAFGEILKRHKNVYLLVAGSGPWGERYEELAPNAKTLGPLTPTQLAEFYNAVDVFVNPTLRSQGLDHTLLEAMQCGKPLLATHFSSIVMSVITAPTFGYTFSPNVDSLIAALEAVVQDGVGELRAKGQACLAYAAQMFTATKMASAYERLFLCMSEEKFCLYPLPSDLPECSSSSSSHHRSRALL
jgi:glycosyltransferase involved in cell wall biosynthesis